MPEFNSKPSIIGYTDLEKGAYLSAIASLATADRSATSDELEHLHDLAESSGLSEEQKSAVVRSASETDGKQLKRSLDILRNSELRFSLATDLIAFAESDGEFSAEERKSVEQITDYLGINKTQVSLLDQFVQRANQTSKSPEEIAKPGFLESLGLKDQFQKQGSTWAVLSECLGQCSWREWRPVVDEAGWVAEWAAWDPYYRPSPVEDEVAWVGYLAEY